MVEYKEGINYEKIRNLIVFILIFSMIQSTAVLAQSNSAEQLSADSIVAQLQSSNLSADVEFFPMDMSRSNLDDEELLHFDTVEEFQLFLDAFIITLREPQKVVMLYDNDGVIMAERSALRHAVATWWGGQSPWGGLFHNRHILFSFSRDSNGRLTSAAVLDSWITGVSGLSWTHRFGSTRVFAFADSVELSALGTWLLGVSIGGAVIGATWNDTWIVDAWPPR